jgi:hypothetical protein
MTEDLSMSCCILKKKKPANVPPAFLNSSSTALSLSGSSIPPPSTPSIYANPQFSVSVPTVSSLANAIYTFRLDGSPSIFLHERIPSDSIEIQKPALDSLSPFANHSSLSTPQSSFSQSLSTSSGQGISLRRAQIIEDEHKDEPVGRPRLLVTI